MLAVGGFISIGLALFAALGLGSAFGLFYSPLMGVFPFLLIGKCPFGINLHYLSSKADVACFHFDIHTTLGRLPLIQSLWTSMC